MRDRILELEKTSRLLEPAAPEREAVRSRVVDYSEDFLNNVESLPTFNISEDKGIGLLDSPITENGIGIDEAISLIRDNVDTPGLNPASGGHLAYIPGGGIYYSALGDYLADVFNRYAGIFYAAPDAVRLANRIDAEKTAGINRFLVVASAGTTDVGAIDPLTEIGKISKEYGLWYHIDAAYGGFFILTEEGRLKLQGLELSDSLIIDPHKGLFLPYGLGVVLVKNIEDLARSYSFDAHYMQDAFAGPHEMSPAELSPELTKHFRGLRLWLPLKLHGVAPFRACLEEKLLLAKYFHAEILALGFESKIEPELSVVTYRWLPKTGDANIFNKRLLDEVVADGQVFISSTMLNGEFTLRFACLAFRTHLSTVDTLLGVLKENVPLLEQSA